MYKINTKKPAVAKKIEQVKKTLEDMKKYKTVALLDLRKLPDALFQNLRKRIKAGGGIVLVLKKPVISRVLKENKILVKYIDETNKPVALILTNDSPYSLNRFFKDNKKKRAAKAGEEALTEIAIEEGETDLPPGPALSELKAGGVNVQIKGGKIVVAKRSVIAKPGDVITVQKAKALTSLGVMPFETMANLIFGFDGEYCYKRDILDLGDTVTEDISASFSQAMNLSMNAGYPTGQNIGVLLTNAMRQSLNLALNADVYSSSSIEPLITAAMRQAKALGGLVPSSEAKAEEKKE